jgi:hypothetical protein
MTIGKGGWRIAFYVCAPLKCRQRNAPRGGDMGKQCRQHPCECYATTNFLEQDSRGVRRCTSTSRPFTGKVNCLAPGYDGIRAAFQ